MFCEFEDKQVKLYYDDRILCRTFNMRLPVIQATVSGEGIDDSRVSITLDNGKTALYHANGVCIRPA